MTGTLPERRAFTSRTLAIENGSKLQHRRGFVTKHQVTGWRFVIRRIASGLALHDTRMLVDPLRSQSRAVGFGGLALITGLLGCLIFSLLHPAGVPGNNDVLSDQRSGALYVKMADQLHPVLNLTSAQLIVGKPVDPTPVKSSELNKYQRGNLLGIPGAPEQMVQNSAHDAQWTVCDSSAVGDHDAGLTVIAGIPEARTGFASDLPARHGVLTTDGDTTWLIWNGRRSAIDLANRAVTGGLGLGIDTPAPRYMDVGLLNIIPAGSPLTVPVIPQAGSPAEFPVPGPIGSVIISHAPDSGTLYYAVLPDGLQPISVVLASILRNNNTFGLDEPPSVPVDQIAKLPVSKLIDTSAYPAEPVTVTDTKSDPVTCARWVRYEAANTSSLTVLSGASLPLPANVRTVDLVSAGPGVATRVALPPGTGYYAQVVGQEPDSLSKESVFWISDTGVRFGIDSQSSHDHVITALGLTNPPLPIPWSVLELFAAGPTLSRADALIEHDGLAPDPHPDPRQLRPKSATDQ